MYTMDHARNILKLSAMQYEEKIFKCVSTDVFPDMKFPNGSDDVERNVILLAIASGEVAILDKKITEDAFVEEFFPQVSKALTVLRQRTVNSARGKFRRKFHLLL